MTRYVVHASAVLHLASTEVAIADDHELPAPTLLRSQTLSLVTKPRIAARSPPTKRGPS